MSHYIAMFVALLWFCTRLLCAIAFLLTKAVLRALKLAVSICISFSDIKCTGNYICSPLFIQTVHVQTTLEMLFFSFSPIEMKQKEHRHKSVEIKLYGEWMLSISPMLTYSTFTIKCTGTVLSFV